MDYEQQIFTLETHCKSIDYEMDTLKQTNIKLTKDAKTNDSQKELDYLNKSNIALQDNFNQIHKDNTSLQENIIDLTQSKR